MEIQQTQIPLAVIALDLKSTKEVILREGSLRKAVSASCAVPGIFPPIKMGAWELVDGGWIDRVPIRPAREMGADLVIAVNVAEELAEGEDFATGLGIFLRAYNIAYCALSEYHLREADLVISPDVSGVHWSDFGHFEECIRIGEEATREKLGDLRRLIRMKKLQKVFRLPWGR